MRFRGGACASSAGRHARQFMKRYLSVEDRDHPEQELKPCGGAGIGDPRCSRQRCRALFIKASDRFVTLAGESLEAVGAEHGHDRAVFMFAAMVGGLALSRAIRDIDGSGSADILRAVKKQLGQMVNS